MLLVELARTSERVAATASRRDKTALLAESLRRLDPDEIRVGVTYLMGRLPQGRIGIGGALLRSAATAAAAQPTVSLAAVDAALDRIAHATGPGSASERRRQLAALYAAATPEEHGFLTRLLSGELRQGALESVLLDAVAAAAGLASDAVRDATTVAGDLAPVAQAVLTEGARGLARFALALFTPLKPMLAQPATDLADALAQLGRAAWEYKLDGARVQVHKRGGEVRVYTRRLNEVTASVPEIVQAVQVLPAAQLVLDGEAIALRPDGRPQPFQLTMRRFGRKLEVERLRAELPLSVFFFDCLHSDGENLLGLSTEERFARLARIVPEAQRTVRLVSGEREEAQAFLDASLGHGHEGLMAKSLAAPYVAGRRGSAWLKIKAAHTLDLVVLAAEWGHGRRHGWLSNLHLGARDPASGRFVMLGKTFKGMTDAMLAWQTERLRALAVAEDRYIVTVRPELVVEIAFNDIQESPQYPAGLALRFARVKRYRPDKTAAEVDTLETVRRLFYAAGGGARDDHS